MKEHNEQGKTNEVLNYINFREELADSIAALH